MQTKPFGHPFERTMNDFKLRNPKATCGTRTPEESLETPQTPCTMFLALAAFETPQTRTLTCNMSFFSSVRDAALEVISHLHALNFPDVPDGRALFGGAQPVACATAHRLRSTASSTRLSKNGYGSRFVISRNVKSSLKRSPRIAP